MKNICIVLGTRPEAIKMAPVIKAFEAHAAISPGLIDVRVCVTGQHRQMLDQVLSLFRITPHYDLNVMRANQDLADLTARVITGVREVLQEFQPDLVLVHGDTTTTFAAALAAYYQRIPVAHVEAGLRTGDIYAPWPEEINRRLTGAIAAIHFAPTEASKQNLVNENIDAGSVEITGNTVIDALLTVVATIKRDRELRSGLDRKFSFLNNEKRLLLVTGHRRENFGGGFMGICKALKEIAERDDIEIIYPVHLNPNVQEPVQRLLSESPSIHLIEPLDYLPFVYLMERSYLILTDSGGIQEEAPSLGKPVLVLRNTTERPEGVESGTVKLVGNDPEVILSEVKKLLDDSLLYEHMASASNPYGNGTAAERIVSSVMSRIDSLC